MMGMWCSVRVHVRVSARVSHQVGVPGGGRLPGVGLDAAHVERVARAQRAHQRRHRAAEQRRRRRGALRRLHTTRHVVTTPYTPLIS